MTSEIEVKSDSAESTKVEAQPTEILAAAISSIAEFTEAVGLIQAAVDSIDQHTETAKQNINNHVETTVKQRIDQLAVNAVTLAIETNQRLRDLLDSFLDPIRRALGLL